MKKHFFTMFFLIAFLSIHAQNTSPPAEEGSDPTLLKGEWAVVSETISPLMIIPHCKPILKGTLFKFTENELTIFTDTLGAPCAVYRFKIIANQINKLSIIKEDMIWLCTYELDTNSLKIKSTNFFNSYQSDTSLPVNKQPALMQEIEVTLIKKYK